MPDGAGAPEPSRPLQLLAPWAGQTSLAIIFPFCASVPLRVCVLVLLQARMPARGSAPPPSKWAPAVWSSASTRCRRGCASTPSTTRSNVRAAPRRHTTRIAAMRGAGPRATPLCHAGAVCYCRLHCRSPCLVCSLCVRCWPTVTAAYAECCLYNSDGLPMTVFQASISPTASNTDGSARAEDEHRKLKERIVLDEN